MHLSARDYKALVEFSPNMIWRSDIDGKLDYFNKTWLAFTGRTLDQEHGAGWRACVHTEDLDRYLKVCAEALNDKKPFHIEYRHKRHDGQWRWLYCQGAPLYDDEGVFVGYVGIGNDVTERHEGEHLKERVLTDDLTGFFKRRYFEERLEQEIERARRHKINLSLVLLDIDNFRAINQKFKHGAGDKVIKMTSTIIKSNIRAQDIPCRVGGDEFGLILPHTNKKDATQVAERIREILESTIVTYERQQIKVTASLAVAVFKEERDAGKLIQRARRMIYDSDRAGGNVVKAA